MLQRSPVSSLGLRLFQADQYISLNQVRMVYGNRSVFDSLSCTFPRQKISVILGGSGLGKSTLLRLIGGLVRPAAGSVSVDGQEVQKLSHRGLSRLRRKMGMMFQGGALLDSYSVFENVALPLREQARSDAAQVKLAVREILDAVSVMGVDDLHPRQLSGGMLRRVALARAIIRRPELLLCDEPFSGLDPASIKRMEALLVKINHQFGMTMIVVSHDIQSTLRMADQVLLVLPGRVLSGSPDELLNSDDPEISEFLGRSTGVGSST